MENWLWGAVFGSFKKIRYRDLKAGLRVADILDFNDAQCLTALSCAECEKKG